MLSAEHSRRKAGTTRQLRELPAAKNLEALGLNVSAHPPQLLDHRYGRWGVSSPGGEKVKRGWSSPEGDAGRVKGIALSPGSPVHSACLRADEPHFKSFQASVK